MIRRSFVCVLLLSLIAGLAIGCGSTKKSASTTAQTTTSARPPVKPVAFTLPVSPVHFGEYTAVPLTDPSSPVYAGPATPHSLDGVKVVPDLHWVLKNKSLVAALEKNGFVVSKDRNGPLELFQGAYQGSEYGGWPVFVTTDVAYHEWHLAFDKVLRDIEQKVLLPKLNTLVSGSLQAAHEQANELKGSSLEDAASRVEQLFQVAAAELGQPGELGKLAEQEKALIDEHTNPNADSPILGTTIDYSIFTPRGHYTRNAQLTRFFKGMSVLGQLAFCLPGTVGCSGVEPARIGILASRVLDRDPDVIALWHQIYEPTAFLVGVADDYTPLEVEAAAKTTAAGGLENAKAFESDAAVNAVIKALVKARPVKINPERSSIRLMGTRFVLDSYLLDQLIAPNVGSGDKLRLTPSALDVAASFGSGYAKRQLKQEGVFEYAHYSKQLARVQKVVSSRPAKDWGSTVYDAWLYALEPVFARHGTAFPDFMRTPAWAAKAQQAGFGSYAELKHDTILYGKQSFAEGDVPTLYPEAPRNWVEPEPVAFARLAEAARLTRKGLAERNLLTKKASGLLTTEIDMFGFFERIAKDELAGRPISARDNKRLRYIGGEFEAIWWRTGDLSPHGDPGMDSGEEIVADISSSPKGVLEVGTGRIDQIYVLVPDDNGNFQLAVGGVYSYYEFLNPPGERLTDTEWRGLLKSGKAPARPGWEKVFLPS